MAPATISSDLTDALCTRCGLCCDGSIFDDVELAGDAEATRLEAMNFAVEDDERPLLLLPCPALRGTRCSIYPHRPGCCRTFTCRLLQRAARGDLTLDRATKTIARTREHAARVRSLCAALGATDAGLPLKERCIEALSQPCDADDDRASALRGELARAMDAMGHLVHEHFLDPASDDAERD